MVDLGAAVGEMPVVAAAAGGHHGEPRCFFSVLCSK
jgi:hypothetical protein